MKTLYNHLIAGLTFGLLIIAAGCGSNDSESLETSAPVDSSVAQAVDSSQLAPPVPKILPNPYFNELAQLIAGTVPFDSLNLLNVDSAYYAMYQQRMGKNFQQITADRLKPMEDFFGGELKREGVDETLPVFYPFAGGDFLHVHQVYPHSRDYHLFALEPIGQIPDYSSVSATEMDSLLHDTETMLRDIFKRSYFITKNMTSDIQSENRTSGLIYTMLWAIGITGHEVYHVEQLHLDSVGVAQTDTVKGREVTFEQGIRISFKEKAATEMRYLTYLDCDISNRKLKRDTAMLTHLKALPRSNTFMKAASYLPHYYFFSTIREIILDRSETIIQDDTGIPWRHVNKKEFKPRLFGVYAPPVSDFTADTLYQPDLERAYLDSNYFGGKMPFSLGYHWNSKLQNQMMFVRQ
ncbi:MAG: hypothetical protein ACO2XQ_05920 [Flavobacteriales bacterium]